MKINPEQRKAIEHGAGPLLIVAGAGTGKTTVITQRLAYLIKEKRALPSEILALTFTDKAAGEMEERADILLPYGYVDLWISTFHSFGERILKDNALDIGLDPGFKLLNQVEQWRLIRQNFNRFELDYYKPMGNPTRFIYALIKVFSRAKDENVTPEQFIFYADKKLKADNNEEAKRILEVAKAYQTYQTLLTEKGQLDFGDLIIKALALLKQRKNILEKYRQQFKYILVDEFQDTNFAQYELLKLLAGSKKNITVVGDDDQSIYKFRGAAISNILEFKKDFPACEEIVLTENYRNRQNILDLSYKFIQLNNPNRLEARLGKKQIDDKGELLTVKITKKLIAQNKGLGKIEHLHFLTQEEEALGVVEKILALRKKNRSLTWNDFAILVRANDQANIFINLMDNQEIPYQYVANRGLYQKPEIMDLIAYLKLLDNYHESTALFRVMNMPIFKFAPEDIHALLNFTYRKNVSLYEAMQNPDSRGSLKPQTQKDLDSLLDLIHKHSKLARDKSVSRVLFQFVEDSGYFKYLAKKQTIASAEAILNINQFFKQLGEFERLNSDKSVKNFMAELDLAIEAGEEGVLGHQSMEEGPEAVKVMTIHQAKGLEFTHVFMVNLVDKRFPSIERKDPIELPDELVAEIIPEGDVHLQEERRLFYVAMTRVKEGLYFTTAEDYGGSRKKRLSRFLYEIELEKYGKRAGQKMKQQRLIFEKMAGQKDILTLKRNLDILPHKFSFTQLKAFDTCPYQYRFAHILHVPVKGKGAFSFGKTIHNTLHEFYLAIQRGEIPTLAALLSMYERNWIDEWYEDKPQELRRKEKGKQVLQEFYKVNKKTFKAPKFLEQGFNIRIGLHTLKGFIDRVDALPDDRVEIIDYKTGNLPKVKSDIDTEQLLIYALACQEVFKLNPAKLTFYYIEDNKTFTYQAKQEEIEEVKKRVVGTIEKILKSDFKATPSQYKCKYCDFKEICEFRTA
ncbi:MAG: UvrD-helicase domain-containing protein [Patescibacteria group bacterium]